MRLVKIPGMKERRKMWSLLQLLVLVDVGGEVLGQFEVTTLEILSSFLSGGKYLN